ncbi:MAG: hypothetical protein LBC64_03840 [Fibromonadaceae bacterium]|jgi:hypothetical protein|nr:hypothetical protein [Fibromonadaceae bacterium]
MEKSLAISLSILLAYSTSFAASPVSREHFYGEWTNGDELTFIYNISANNFKMEAVDYTSNGIPLKASQPILKWEYANNLDKALNANFPNGYLVKTKYGNGTPTYFYLWKHHKNKDIIMYQPEALFLERRYDIWYKSVSSSGSTEEGYTKDIWFCKVAEVCELSDYTGDYTKNCEKFDSVSVYWEYAYDKYNNSLFCHKYNGIEKQCTKIISNDTDKNSAGDNVLIIKGATIDYIFGDVYESHGFLNIIYHTKDSNVKYSHTLCQPLHLDFKKSSKNKGY